MVIARRFFENMPVHVRLADELGLLEYFCDEAIQPGLNELHRLLEQREFLFDYRHPATWGYLDYLAQFVFLGAVEDHWVGIGLNPNWETSQKIKVISRFLGYLKKKGAVSGVRQAIELWGEVPPEQISFEFPYETHWFDHYTLFTSPVNQKVEQRSRFGSGDYRPGSTFFPDYKISEAEWDGETDPLSLPWVDAPPLPYERSQIGPRSLWEIIRCRSPQEVNQIGERIINLNFETLPAMVDACPWVVVEVPTTGGSALTGPTPVSVALKTSTGSTEAPLLGYLPDGFLYWDLFQLSGRRLDSLFVDPGIFVDNGLTIASESLPSLISNIDLSTATLYPADAPPSRRQGHFQLNGGGLPPIEVHATLPHLDNGITLPLEETLSLEGLTLEIQHLFPSSRVLIGYTDHFCSHQLIDIGESTGNQVVEAPLSLGQIISLVPVNGNVLEGDRYYLILLGSTQLMRVPVSTITTPNDSMVVARSTQILLQFACRLESPAEVTQSLLCLEGFGILKSTVHAPISLLPGISYLWEYQISMEVSLA